MSRHCPGLLPRLLLLLVLPAACRSPTEPPAEPPAAPPTAPPTESPATVRIPCTRTPTDNLVVQARLNGSQPVVLMLHTAVDSVSLTTAAIARLTCFDAKTTIPVQSWGGTTQARHSPGNTLQLGPLAVPDVAITECTESGPGSDGKFGPNLFGDRIVEIDADAGAIVLHTSLPPLDAHHVRLDLVRRGSSLFVLGELGTGDRTVPAEFLLHTGFSGTLLLDEPFVREHGLATQLPTIAERTLHDSFGNPVTTRTVRLPRLRLGTLVVDDVPAALFDAPLGGQRTHVLGAGLLLRCHLVLDEAHGHLYLAPGRRFREPFGN